MSSKKVKVDDLIDDDEVERKRSFMEGQDDDDDEDADLDVDDENEDEDSDDKNLEDEDEDDDEDEEDDDESLHDDLDSHDPTDPVDAIPKTAEEDEDDDEVHGEILLSQEDRLKNEIRDLAEKINDEVIHLQENFDLEEIRKVIQEIDFFNTNQSDECLEKFCENLQTTMGHCRYHYIKNWKRLKKKRAILKEGKLQEYIEELISKYPTKYIEAIMQDIQGEKQFFNVLKDLNIDSHFNVDDPDSDLDAEDDLHVDARNLTGARMHFDDDDIL